jgi:hypothetical protein
MTAPGLGFVKWSYKKEGHTVNVWVQWTRNEEQLTQLSNFIRDKIKNNTNEIKIDLATILSEEKVDILVKDETKAWTCKQKGKFEFPTYGIHRKRCRGGPRESHWDVWLEDYNEWLSDAIYDFFDEEVPVSNFM